MSEVDQRNVTDEFKAMPENRIIELLDERGADLEIAIENTLRDFNMGTIVRSANAFGIRHIHVVGRRQWNKRGAMMTDKYVHMHYHDSFDDLARYAEEHGRIIIALDNIAGSTPLSDYTDRPSAIMVFGQEGPGLSSEALTHAAYVLAIEQNGSTRSLNVGVAAGIAMYTWLTNV